MKHNSISTIQYSFKTEYRDTNVFIVFINVVKLSKADGKRFQR